MTKLFIAVGMLVAGCSSLQAPNLLDPGKEPAPALELSDARIFRFSDELVKWWGLRSMHAEVFGVGTGIAMDAMTTAAVAASGGGVSPDIVRGLIAGVDFLKSAFQRVDPRSRDNAFNTGSTIVLTSQGEYLSCISKRGAAVPNEKAVTSCGAKFLIKLNSSIAVTGALMVGTLASRDDLDKVTTPIAPDPEPAPVKPVTPATLIGPMTPATPRPLP